MTAGKQGRSMHFSRGEADAFEMQHRAGLFAQYDQRPLYHGTHVELKPGDELRPPAVTGHKSRFEETADYYDPFSLYHSDQPHLAGRYAYRSAAHHGGQPHVYEVSTHSAMPDPERETGFGADQWVSKAAKVVREVPHDEWWDARRAKAAGF